jgi:hypothetical protein
MSISLGKGTGEILGRKFFSRSGAFGMQQRGGRVLGFYHALILLYGTWHLMKPKL